MGKSTLANMITKSIDATGKRCFCFPFPGKAKGSLGKLVYDLHHSPTKFHVKSMDQTSLQIMHVAAHIDLIESRIKPLIRSGATVILDRFWWSTFVYGTTLGARRDSLKALINLEKLHWSDLEPSMILLVARSNPIGVAKDGHWKRLALEYRSLAKKEKTHYPVHILNNDSNLGRTYKRLQTMLSLD